MLQGQTKEHRGAGFRSSDIREIVVPEPRSFDDRSTDDVDEVPGEDVVSDGPVIVPPPRPPRPRVSRLQALAERVRSGEMTQDGLRNLRGLVLDGLDLRRANLADCDLSEVRFAGAQLAGASLRNSRLHGAELADAQGLGPDSLAGADMQDAVLPNDLARFEHVHTVSERSKNCRALLWTQAAACVYALITVGTTTDVSLASGSGTARLPVLESEVPIAVFFVLSPLVVATLYVYLHLSLLRLWEACARMPAVFPNGRLLDEVAYPWLPLSLVRARVARLSGRRQQYGGFQRHVLHAAIFWFVPLTLYFHWARAVALGNSWLTALHVALLCGCGVAALVFDVAGRRAFDSKADHRRLLGLAGPALGATTIVLAVTSAIPGEWRLPGYKPSLQDFRGADLVNADLEGIQAAHADFALARLRNAVLDNANLAGASLRDATLQEAYLRDAVLERADLRDVQMGAARLNKANLRSVRALGASFAGAYMFETALGSGDFENADFTGAILANAKLSGASLVGADFSSANLTDADLSGADLSSSILKGAILTGATFEGAVGLSQSQLDDACGGDTTTLPEPLSVRPCSD